MMSSSRSSMNTPINIDLSLPEALVLIIVTGGTICMKRSDRGLVPAPNFLKFGLYAIIPHSLPITHEMQRTQAVLQ